MRRRCEPSRRTLVTGGVALMAAGFAGLGGRTVQAQPLTPVRFTLDWKYQGVHAFYFVALDKGYFRDEGIDMAIDQGEGSAASISRIMTGRYDAAIGDISALIVAAVEKPELAPTAVYMVHDRTPSALIVRANGPIKTLKDLEGQTVGAPAGSATERLLPVLARLNNFDISKVARLNLAAALAAQMLKRGAVGGILNFNYSMPIDLPKAGLDPKKDVRIFNYSDYGLDIYMGTIMVSQALRKKPQVVKGMVKAINRGIKDAMENPDEAIRTLLRVEPLLNFEQEKMRLVNMFQQIVVTPWTRAHGLGGADDVKLTRTISLITEGYELARPPKSEDVYDSSFLPSASDRRMRS